MVGSPRILCNSYTFIQSFLSTDSGMSHRWLLCVCVLTDILVLSESAEFEVHIDGVNVGRSSSCIGENVTYVCNITSTNHVWNVPGSVTNRNMVWNNPPVPDGEYKLRVVSEDGTNIIASSLSVNSSAELNNTSITCATGFDTNSTRATTVAMVLDTPSIPMLNVTVDNIETLVITVIPPLVSPVCVLQYIITNSYSCDSTVTNITVIPSTNPTEPVQFTRDGLSLCDCSYTFTVAADTRNGIGERSGPISRGLLSTASNDQDLNINTSDFYVTVSVTAPEVINIVIKYTSISGTNISLDVMKENGMAESETLLECGFTNSRVDFFVEFVPQCGMKTITDTTSPLPRLILSVTQSASTFSSIHLVLTINECVGKDQLTVLSSVSDNNGVILSVNTSIYDMITFKSLPTDKNYVCKVAIIDEDNTLDFEAILCQTSSTSSSTSTSEVLGVSISFSLIVSFLLGFSLGLLLMWCWNKKKFKDTSHQQPSSDQVYETVSTPQANVIELETNKAYGYLK